MCGSSTEGAWQVSYADIGIDWPQVRMYVNVPTPVLAASVHIILCNRYFTTITIA